MKNCSVEELRNSLNGGSGQLIDVREPSEFAVGHVTGATNIPVSKLGSRLKNVEHWLPLFVMCQTGRRSAKAQQELSAMGFTAVTDVTGGFAAWRNAGFAYARDANARWSLERQVRIAAGSLVLLGVLLAFIAHPVFIFISVLIGAGLVFSAATDTCAMGMLLAKMPWNKQAARCECGCEAELKALTSEHPTHG